LDRVLTKDLLEALVVTGESGTVGRDIQVLLREE
jgi:hypothetical protein